MQAMASGRSPSSLSLVYHYSADAGTGYVRGQRMKAGPSTKTYKFARQSSARFPPTLALRVPSASNLPEQNTPRKQRGDEHESVSLMTRIITRDF
jgi:hypothetical protein